MKAAIEGKPDSTARSRVVIVCMKNEVVVETEYDCGSMYQIARAF
jgi:hypothetical protein